MSQPTNGKAHQGLKHLLQKREARQRQLAWQQFLEIYGPGKLTKEEFSRIFVEAYWTGARDVLQAPVPRNPANEELRGTELIQYLSRVQQT